MARRQMLTKARWIALQAVLVGVLAVTVGLAALVKRGVEASMDVELAPPVRLGTLSLRLPEGWEHEAEVASAEAAIFAFSPSGQQPQRRLEIHHSANPRNLKPDQFLARPSILHPDYPRDLSEQAPNAQLRWSGRAEIAGVQGIMLEGFRIPREAALDTHLHEVFICGQAGQSIVLVKLQSRQTRTDESRFGDRVLARKIAESIRIEQPLLSERAAWIEPR